MFGPREHETAHQHVLRLAARAASVVCLAVILLFLVGEDFNFADVTARQWVGFAFFPVGLVAGLVLAWKEEGLGGTIAVISILGVYLVYGLLLNGTLRLGWAFLPFLIPGVLFIAYRLGSHPPRTQSSERHAH